MLYVNAKTLRMGLYAAVLSLSAGTALAAAQDPQGQTAPERSWEETQQDVKQGWKNTKETTKEGWDKTKGMAREGWSDTKQAANKVYDEITHYVTGKDELNPNVPYTLVDEDATAKHVLGKEVVGTDGRSLATLEDVIINRNGEVTYFVLSDGSFLGLAGKKVAVEASMLTKGAEGKLVLPTTEAGLDNMAAFSYDTADASPGTVVLSENLVSIDKLIGADMYDSNNKKIGPVEDVVMSSTGEATHLVFAFDQMLGMGGDRAVVGFNGSAIHKDKDGNLKISFNEAQTQSLNRLRKAL